MFELFVQFISVDDLDQKVSSDDGFILGRKRLLTMKEEIQMEGIKRKTLESRCMCLKHPF